jgi:hypothetical protein
MDMKYFMKFMGDNMPFLVVIMAVVILIMLCIMIKQAWTLSYMKKRYRKMMSGVDGDNLERLLMGHIDEVRHVVEEKKQARNRVLFAGRLGTHYGHDAGKTAEYQAGQDGCVAAIFADR